MFVSILNEMNWDELYQLQNKIIINFKFIISGVFNSSVHAKLVEVSEDEENDEKIVTKYVFNDACESSGVIVSRDRHWDVGVHVVVVCVAPAGFAITGGVPVGDWVITSLGKR